MTKDMVGKKFNRWTVNNFAYKNDAGTIYYNCTCDCGTNRDVIGTTVRTGRSKSCGCFTNEMIIKAFNLRSERKNQTLLGKRYGRLTIISFSHKDDKSNRYFLCKCDCGNEKVLLLEALTTGNTSSCGCYRRDYLLKRHAIGTPLNRFLKIIKTQYKNSAKNRNYVFMLTDLEFENLVLSSCVYCGEPAGNSRTLVMGGISYTFKYNGIDRIDSNQGYSIDNVVSCCITCNIAKNAKSIDAFKEWVLKVYDIFKLKKHTNGFFETVASKLRI